MSSDTKPQRYMWSYAEWDLDLFRDDDNSIGMLVPGTCYMSKEAAKSAAQEEVDENDCEEPDDDCRVGELKWVDDHPGDELSAATAIIESVDWPDGKTTAAHYYRVYPMLVVE